MLKNILLSSLLFVCVTITAAEESITFTQASQQPTVVLKQSDFNRTLLLYKTCFTPGENCTAQIIALIGMAKESIHIQAYNFTDSAVANALIAASKRGIEVIVILDKSQASDKTHSVAKFLKANNIPVFVDFKPAIAHNKTIILDEVILITGSFNLTESAQKRNAENVLMLICPPVAEDYLVNFKEALSRSMPLNAYTELRHSRDN